MWYIITIVSSLSLVLFLGLAVFFPLRVHIVEEERSERPQRIKHTRKIAKRKHSNDFDDELYFDDDEL
ncbi:MAG: hypothetical protein LBQ05_00140 [Christensenellaceae bacterium]|nr:hypothetical protein [Christensenellaceae bacterium]